MSNWLLGLPGASRKRKPEEDVEEEEEDYDETVCRRYLGGALLARETVPQALKRLRKGDSGTFDRVSKMASLMSDNGHMDVYSKPREQIWSHSYAQDVTIEQVLFGSKQAKEDPAAAAEYEQPEAVMYDFSEPGSYWQYCVTDVTGQPGEYQGPFPGESMTGWQAQGYFSGSNVHIWKYTGPFAVQEPEPVEEKAPAAAPPERPVPDAPSTGGMSSMRGRRAHQENRCSVVNNLYTLMPKQCGSQLAGHAAALYSVFDGHHGDQAAEYCLSNLPTLVASQLQAIAVAGHHDPFTADSITAAFTQSFATLDYHFLELAKKNKVDDGSTASCALVLDRSLYIANLGDSRCILSKAGKGQPCSWEHVPNVQIEHERVVAAGGEVRQADDGGWRIKRKSPHVDRNMPDPFARVSAMVSVSRALGDRRLKHPQRLIDSVPDVTNFQLEDDDELLVMGSVGVWAVVGVQEAVDMAMRAKEHGKTCMEAAQRITSTAIDRESPDNVTCIVVYLHGTPDAITERLTRAAAH